MNGKSDTMAIFENYKQILKEQDETTKPSYVVMDIIVRMLDKDPTKQITGRELTKLVQFLNDEKTLAAYDAFKIIPPKIDAGVIGKGGITSKDEGDASAANMGEGGVLEVQPDGQYPQ
jgi:hypothetical protein